MTLSVFSLLCVLTCLDVVQQKSLAIHNARKVLNSSQVLDCSFLGGGSTASEAGTTVYPYPPWHTKQQCDVTGKLAHSQSGYLASSCAFVTNLQINC